MCGIIGYRGPRDPVKVIFEGLKRLEYRGYDSWGLAVRHGRKGKFQRVRRVGKISAALGELEKAFPTSGRAGKVGKGSGRSKDLNIGIGHTRWATHGGVTVENSHPHQDRTGHLIVVHNGIVENYRELKDSLGKGRKFASETDTEVIAHLLEDEYSKTGDLLVSFMAVFNRLEGRNAVVLLAEDRDEMYVARNGSPVVIGLGDGEQFVASDVPAFLEYTKRVHFLGDNEVAIIGDTVTFWDIKRNRRLTKEAQVVEWDASLAEKGEFPYFMLKEMLEQPVVLPRAVNQTVIDLERAAAMVRNARSIFAVGCGTAAQVAHISSYLFSEVANVHVMPVLGSEFENYHHFLTKESLLIAISQSGETADLLEAVKVAKSKGVKILAILNVRGSTLMREADHTLLVHAGPEKAVASTKATTAQLAVLLLLAHALAGRADEARELIRRASQGMGELLREKSLEQLKGLAAQLKDEPNIYLIGRGINYPVAREGAIKIQEVSTLHAEGIAGGELKHYALALIEKGTPCFALVPKGGLRKEILSNAMEIRSRGGLIIGISPENSEVFDTWIRIPDAGAASPLVTLLPLQLFAYYLALERGFDPDYCRNLAKSVTVK